MKNYMPLQGYRFLSTFNLTYTYTNTVSCFLMTRVYKSPSQKNTGTLKMEKKGLPNSEPLKAIEFVYYVPWGSPPL